MLLKGIRSGFYRQLYVLVLPIMIQNLITSAVSMADVMMLGRLDQTSLAAASLAGQVQFLLGIVYFGLASALTILASQYWGKGDKKTVGRIFGIGLIISVPISSFAMIMALFFPGTVIRIWTNVPELIEAGKIYLRFVALSYFFAGFTQPYLSIMKSCERVLLSTVISAVTLGLNIVLNAVLIFGLFGMPGLGIKGAAIATAACRGVELVICLIDFTRQKVMPKSIVNIFTIPKTLALDFARYSLPAFLNDAMWGLAFNMNSVIMGHLGSDIVAANSVVTVVRDLISVVGFAISAAAAILLGKEIGSGRLDLAEEDASGCVRVSLLICICQGILLLILAPVIPGFVKVSETAAGFLRIMLIISSVYQVGQVMNTLLIASVFRCGGDSRYGLILDLVTMWGIAVPLGLISAFVLKLPPMVVYFLMCTDEFVKLPSVIYHYRKKGWLKNLTREYAI